ncbi:MAG: hypothetical protein CYG60_07070 [Actinobacteria bacterium]|nr:MAG: hypothetical protein CYG60_07070 [Actinomycetota bacterium]
MHMGYEPEEVDRLPWWKQKMWIEKLNQHFSPPEQQPPAHDEHVEVSDDITALGITPQNIA